MKRVIYFLRKIKTLIKVKDGSKEVNEFLTTKIKLKRTLFNSNQKLFTPYHSVTNFSMMTIPYFLLIVIPILTVT